MDTLWEPSFATARSGWPSSLKSPTATECGADPTPSSCAAAKWGLVQEPAAGAAEGAGDAEAGSPAGDSNAMLTSIADTEYNRVFISESFPAIPAAANRSSQGNKNRSGIGQRMSNG